MSDQPLRIAMWSGPRNISTALMRSWGNRSDTVVCDEPLYAHYLAQTGADHPGREEIVAHHETDWRKVADWLTGPIPDGKTIFYQKHMGHHLLEGIGRDWLSELTHCFLIRDPEEMLTSLIKITPQPTVFDTALPQQVELFRMLRDRTGRSAPVLDSRDVLDDPRGILSALCERLGVPFEEAMLHWPAGPRESDGIWAEHWYGQVNTSTGFRTYRPKNEAVPDSLQPVLEQCRPLYEELFQHRIPRAA